MSAARKVEGEEPVRQEREFQFCCRRVGCGAKIGVMCFGMAGARKQVMDMGWRFRKMPSHQGPVEVWTCAPCSVKVAEAIKKHNAKKLLKYTTEAPKITDDERDFLVASSRHDAGLTKFQRGFGRILTAAEMSACDRLLGALMKAEIAGNASMSYDGIGINNLSYGAKTVQEGVLDALTYVRQCKQAVQGGVQMQIHDAWRCLIVALLEDLGVQETGNRITQLRKDRQKRKEEALALARDVIQRTASAIKDIRY